MLLVGAGAAAQQLLGLKREQVLRAEESGARLLKLPRIHIAIISLMEGQLALVPNRHRLDQ